VCKTKNTDHVVVIGGWGVDAATGLKYWVGRNSYGTQWGEGAGGGWFRLQRGEFTVCSCEHIGHSAVSSSLLVILRRRVHNVEFLSQTVPRVIFRGLFCVISCCLPHMCSRVN
jgi:hypothetical protein